MRPKGTAEQLERRRLQALELLEAGYSQAEVARRLGVTQGAVSQWRKKAQEGGKQALLAKPQPHRPCRLTPEQQEQLQQMLLEGACHHGFPTALWTLERVALLIERHFGVHYNPSSVWHLLRRLGWSAQKPQCRSRRRNPEAIERWRQKEWPRIKKSRGQGPEPRFAG